MSRLRQQKQIQRHHSDGEQSRVSEIRRGESEYSEVWGREGLALVRSNRSDSGEALQQQIRSSTGNQLNESRSTIIADYRTASTAAQRATETVRASLTAYSGTEQNNRRIREIQQRTGDALQSSDRARQRVGQHHQATTESDFISRFIAKLGEQLKQRLQSHLEQLVTGLSIEDLAKTIIEHILPQMVEDEIKSQLNPLTEPLIEKLSSVEQYQQNLED